MCHLAVQSHPGYKPTLILCAQFIPFRQVTPVCIHAVSPAGSSCVWVGAGLAPGWRWQKPLVKREKSTRERQVGRGVERRAAEAPQARRAVLRRLWGEFLNAGPSLSRIGALRPTRRPWAARARSLLPKIPDARTLFRTAHSS